MCAAEKNTNYLTKEEASYCSSGTAFQNLLLMLIYALV